MLTHGSHHNCRYSSIVSQCFPAVILGLMKISTVVLLIKLVFSRRLYERGRVSMNP